LIRGSGGIFDVFAGDVRVYSKHETGRFPDQSEIIAALRSLAR
jgi:predicted Rdx family selenoprotein